MTSVNISVDRYVIFDHVLVDSYIREMKEMQRWLRRYERVRNNIDVENAASWLSSKYDLEGLTWDEIREIYIPELDMCFGPSCEALRKSWYHYKRLGRDGGYRGDIAYRINKIQNALGFPISEFLSYRRKTYS